ncbi:hypothetical protein AVL48_14465 [Amycolatopsis regifaucium]|uniref:Uncharacterized protein n=1 Tax=Amycolatopsis regifaucium TaxID=546365 RepID=A0A154M8R5_9PSEU|nr:hypothetical protein AVL48_14465 [Amycolatopsis regifaucium]
MIMMPREMSDPTSKVRDVMVDVGMSDPRGRDGHAPTDGRQLIISTIMGLTCDNTRVRATGTEWLGASRQGRLSRSRRGRRDAATMGWTSIHPVETVPERAAHSDSVIVR